MLPSEAPDEDSSSDRARDPQPLNDLAQFVQQLTGTAVSPVEETLGEGFVRLRVEEAERRQAAHDIRWVEDAVVELLRNSRDAEASHIYLATTKVANMRHLVVIDDGVGIPEAMHDSIFEARVTSKLNALHLDRWGVHGRGMALFSIRQNAQEARVISSLPGLGTSIGVVFDESKIKERKDQSTWPRLGEGSEGVELKGPNNIPKACAAFALDDQTGGSPAVFLGSPAEIVATLRREARSSKKNEALLFVRDLACLPIDQRLLAAASAAELSEQATALGLSISERTAHRILGGAIRPLQPVSSHFHPSQRKAARQSINLSRDPRKIKFTAEDAREFTCQLTRIFEPFAQRYYLELKEAPQLRIGDGKIIATFFVANDEEG